MLIPTFKQMMVEHLSSTNQNGYADIVGFLLKANANPNLYANNGVTPFFMASQKGHAHF